MSTAIRMAITLRPPVWRYEQEHTASRSDIGRRSETSSLARSFPKASDLSCLAEGSNAPFRCISSRHSSTGEERRRTLRRLSI